jgi:hypothetical protein
MVFQLTEFADKTVHLGYNHNEFGKSPCQTQNRDYLITRDAGVFGFEFLENTRPSGRFF